MQGCVLSIPISNKIEFECQVNFHGATNAQAFWEAKIWIVLDSCHVELCSFGCMKAFEVHENKNPINYGIIRIN